MTKTIKAILIAVASVLVISLSAGLIVHFTKGKTDKPEANKPTEEYELSGKVYGDGDNVVTVSLSAGSHMITQGDVLGLFALTLSAV